MDLSTDEAYIQMNVNQKQYLYAIPAREVFIHKDK